MFSSIIVGITVLICSLSLWNFMSRVLFEDLTEKVKVTTRNLTLSVSPSLASADNSAVVQICKEVVGRKDGIKYIVIAPSKGDMLAFIKDRWFVLEKKGPWVSDQFQTVSTSLIPNPLGSGECLRYAQKIAHETQNFGWVHVGYDTARYRAHMYYLYQTTLWIGALTWLIGVVAAFVFSVQMVLPIRKLKGFAGKIAGGDLGGEIVLNHHGELSELAEAMSWMSSSLKQSRKELEDSLKREASLREKEILLREIHHRVKNNMQILGSLIRMQSRRVADQSLRPVFRESEDRIRSMALIHEKLYQSESLSRVELQSYLEDLTRELKRVYGESQAVISVEAEGMMLELDSAVPCGLIVNELVSNSLKHAFPAGECGSIHVRLTGGVDGQHELAVWDNGVGMPEFVNLETSQSLGLRLVGMLVEQLSGTCEYKNGVGSHFEIKFKQSSYRERV